MRFSQQSALDLLELLQTCINSVENSHYVNAECALYSSVTQHTITKKWEICQDNGAHVSGAQFLVWLELKCPLDTVVIHPAEWIVIFAPVIQELLDMTIPDKLNITV